MRAQGLGPDPFRPYNRQYDPYTVPMAPADAVPGQFVGGLPRSGIRGANQYQNYLEELQGASRESTERYGIGMPYYRSAVDPSFVDPKGTRDYKPNRDADRSYEESQGQVMQKYLAYLTEKDPKKRAALLKDYNRSRGKFERVLSARREDPKRVLEVVTGAGPEARRSAAGPDTQPRSSSTDRARAARPGDSTRRSGDSTIPPPPPLFGTGSARGTRTPRTPDDVLNRARRLDATEDVRPGRGVPAPALSTPGARPASEFPPPE